MTSNHLKKVSVFILIIGFLCTCLFGCTDKPTSGNDVNSTTESTTKGEESTTIDTDGGNEEDSSVHKEKSPVKKDDETTTNKKTNVKESSTKKVDKETTTKGTTTTEPTTEAYTPAPLVPLTAEQELKIKEDYLEYRMNESGNTVWVEDYEDLTIEHVNLKYYFGTYNNCNAILIDLLVDGYATAIYVENIAGYEFSYSVMRTITVYNNGTFVTLNDAYEKGWLSKENIRDIHYFYVNR